MLTAKPLKPKKCKSCREPFTPKRRIQPACSPVCEHKLALANVEKAERKRAAAAKKAAKAERMADNVKRASLKTRQEWLKDAEYEVNRYVRLRDHRFGCVSCDRPASWDGQWHASHFRSVGAASAVRYHLWNIHKACSVCNNHKSGNLSEYEPRLRALIGDEKVDWLRTQNQRAEYSIDYLKRLKAVFRRKANRQEKRL